MSAAPNGQNAQAAAAMQMIVEAVISGDASIVPQAVNAGLNIGGIRGPHGMNLLHMAAGSGHGDVVEALLSAGLDPQEPMDHGFLPIDLAREEGHADVVRLLETVPGNASQSRPQQAKPAQATGHTTTVNATQMIVQAVLDNDLASVQQALTRGLNIQNIRGPKGDTLLHLAAQEGHTDMVKLLLDAGVDPLVETLNGMSATETAIASKHVETARVLHEAIIKLGEEAQQVYRQALARQADAAREQTAPEPALASGAPAEPLATPTAPVEQRVLLTSEKHLYGTPVDDLVDHWKPGQSRVMARLRKSWADAKRRVADEQAAKDAMNGKTPAPVPSSAPKASLPPEAPHPADATVQVLDAISSGDHSTLERLLRDDPALAQVHEEGLTLLHLAADNGNPRVVRVLLDAGLDPQAASHDGVTALDLAREAGNPDVIALLDPTMNASVPAAQEDPVDEQPASASEGERFERLAEACAAGDLATVQTLVNEDDTSLLDVKETSGAVALHFAVLSDDPRTVGYLIALRPDGDGLRNLMTMPLRHRPEDQGGPYSPLDLARVLQKDAAAAVLEMACESLGIDGETNHVIAMYGPDGTPHVKVLNRFTKTPVHPGMAERITKAVVQKMTEERGG